MSDDREKGSFRGSPSKDDVSRTVSSYAPWQIPLGVTRGNWEYVQAEHIARGYDEFLNEDPLTTVDRQIIDRYLPSVSKSRDSNPPMVADFGCGNGRTLAPLLSRGYQGLGIDLSTSMLQSFFEKESSASSPDENETCRQRLALIRANLVELDGLEDDSVDHGISMFSTLGMIEGHRHRAAFLKHARRIIRPNGLFIVHAHNVWFQLRHPGGVRWALKSGMDHLRGCSEFGDRSSNYRNIRNVFIHSFRRGELAAALTAAGFSNFKWFGILPGKNQPLECPGMSSWHRVVGWIVVCSQHSH